jgi:DNA-binding phage protein
MKMKTSPWDPVDRLKTDEARVAYREAAQEFGDKDLIAVVEADIARAEQRYAEARLEALRRFRRKLPAAERLSRDAANADD